MEANETVLSDVHVFVPFQKSESSDVACTRFYIKQLTSRDGCHDNDEGSSKDHSCHVIQDDDGDFIVERISKTNHEVITIEHKLATVLKDVGLQVWRGALLLCDFIIDNEQKFDNCCGLELGAGVGLCSIVLGRVAARVFCTDFGEDILRNCQNNAQINAHLCKNSRGNGSVVKVRKLDWTKGMSEGKEGTYSWSKVDIDELSEVSVVFAADVIYEDHLTDALFKQISYLIQRNVKAVFYLSIEKRINFTLDDLDVACPAYDHFIQTIETLQSDKILQVRRIPAVFAQYFDYERVKELELWEMKTS